MLHADATVEDGTIFFISDAHLGSPDGPADRESWLIDLMKEAAESARALFILGDLFDFWFEYRRAVPKETFRICRAIADCVDNGVEVFYLGGNHDFWVCDYLQSELGVRSFADPINAHLHGRWVHMAHGDGLGPGDGAYKVLKSILRHPIAIGAYRLLHPDFGIPFANFASTASRGKHVAPREILVPRVVRDIARPRLQGETSAMLMGHVHMPTHVEEDGREFLLIGDWIEKFTHVRMEKASFTLYQRQPDGTHQPLAREPFPPSPPG